MRIQLALNVRDLEAAVAFYGRLFGATPHKRKPGYANFAIDKPLLKLVLFERPDATERLNHLGVEVFDASELEAAAGRLRDSGLTESSPSSEHCCHAVQDKVWTVAPDGEAWEWYRITDDHPVRTEEACCA